MTEVTATSSTAQATPWSLLIAARESQNLTQADIARQLKLSVAQVDALERGDFDRLPGPVFVRGFIRNYARLAKADVNQVMEALEVVLPHPAQGPVAEQPDREPEVAMPVAPGRPWKVYGIIAAILLIALGIWEFGFNEPEGSVAPQPVPVAPAPAPAAPVQTPAVTEQSATPAADAATATPPAAETAPAATSTVPASDTKPATAAPAKARQGEASVKLSFERESWVQIQDRDGRTIFSQLNRAGTEQSVTGLAPLSFIVGNARGVRLTYNDKAVDLERYTKVDVARFTLE